MSRPGRVNFNSTAFHDPQQESMQGRLHPRKSEVKIDNAISKVNQDTVFSLPELLDIIALYLTQEDLRMAIRVCSAWNALWVPKLYSSLQLNDYTRQRKYPNLWTYGEYVKDLRLTTTRWTDVLHLLGFIPNLQSFQHRYTYMSLTQLQEFTTRVPQLRSLSLSFACSEFSPSDCTLDAVAALTNLEEISWEQPGCQVRIDHLLALLKSCTRLRALSLTHISFAEGLESTSDLVRVEDAGCVNTAFQSLKLMRLMLTDSFDQAQPCIHRFFQHVPNLINVSIGHQYLFSPSDWECIFKDRSNMQRVELYSFGSSYLLLPADDVDGVQALTRSCPNLKVLVLKGTPTPDEGFEQLMRVNHCLERVDVGHTKFGDLSLKELVRGPSSSALASGSRSSIHSLVELDLRECSEITSRSAALIFENCEVLRYVNLFGTMAGTIDLFKGDKPWRCANTLENLRISIHSTKFEISQVMMTHNPYSLEEDRLIRERLRSLRSLVFLNLLGDALHLDLFNDCSFAPRLVQVCMVIVTSTVGNLDVDDVDAEEKIATSAKAIFPGWLLMAQRPFRGRFTIDAKKPGHYFQYDCGR
ncbi:hypothetical protein EDD21DRAFT_361976 [Dissophora ornata]|nr:hypothetical protein EDD21DRAFT_361976 [Dissophora ornata]